MLTLRGQNFLMGLGGGASDEVRGWPWGPSTPLSQGGGRKDPVGTRVFTNDSLEPGSLPDMWEMPIIYLLSEQG